jgi:hypothetical protein
VTRTRKAIIWVAAVVIGLLALLWLFGLAYNIDHGWKGSVVYWGTFFDHSEDPKPWVDHPKVSFVDLVIGSTLLPRPDRFFSDPGGWDYDAGPGISVAMPGGVERIFSRQWGP